MRKHNCDNAATVMQVTTGKLNSMQSKNKQKWMTNEILQLME